MEFHDLEVFLMVIRERSFSRAAKRVFRTQPAVSLSIRRLEQQLEGVLFDRSSKEPMLTDLGYLLEDYAKRLMHLRDEIRPAVAELRGMQRGKVHIAANEIGAIFLLSHISAFRRVHPGILVEVQRYRSRDIPQAIIHRHIDLGIVSYDPQDPQLASLELYNDYLTLVAFPGHPFVKHKHIAFSALGDESFVAHYVEGVSRNRIIELFNKNKVPLKVVAELPTVESVKKAVAMEEGLAIIPRMAIDDELKRGTLVEVLVPEIRGFERKLRAIYLQHRHFTHAAQAFLDILKEYQGNAHRHNSRLVHNSDNAINQPSVTQRRSQRTLKNGKQVKQTTQGKSKQKSKAVHNRRMK